MRLFQNLKINELIIKTRVTKKVRQNYIYTTDQLVLNFFRGKNFLKLKDIKKTTIETYSY